MQKTFGLLLIVVMIWVGIEVFTKGTHEAFGGALAFLSDEPAPATPEEHQWAGERAEGRWKEMYKAQTDRVDKQITD